MSAPRVETFSDLTAKIRTLETPTILAIDGRSASGKTTFAKRISSALNAPVVHSDDVAWHHSFFDWWPLMLEQIVMPFQAGWAIDWKPEAWTAQGREGSIQVPQSSILILEGVSVIRQELSQHINLPIWVETDTQVAEARGLERDGPDGHDFWFEWQASERSFLERDKPWDRAKLIVDGAPSLEHDPETQFVMIKNALI
jgi:ABC-type dipeptide/oligopeptide/nickel transport system ATPase component